MIDQANMAALPRPLRGVAGVPSDKSLVHRAVLFASIAEGTSCVRSKSIGRDNLASIRVMQQLGVNILCRFSKSICHLAEEEGINNISILDDRDGQSEGCYSESCELVIHGKGLTGLTNPTSVLFCGNSGTTSRLLLGILAAANIRATLDGDASLRRRPFRRVTEPLTLMGAQFSGDTLPIEIKSGVVRGIHYRSPKASAQVKSSILLAGLGVLHPAEQPEVVVNEPALSRDHTEKMFSLMGCHVKNTDLGANGWAASLPLDPNCRRLRGSEIEVAGDFSAAAFLMAAASLAPGSEVLITSVGINPTRVGFLKLLRRMGAEIETRSERVVSGESVADLHIKSAPLSGISILSEDVVYAIDEVPILTICAAFAQGETVITGAEELRVKESDRLREMAIMLSGAGIKVEERSDGLRICGNPALLGSKYSNETGSQYPAPNKCEFVGKGDHRIAMCASIFNYLLSGRFNVIDERETETSFPGFGRVFNALLLQ